MRKWVSYVIYFYVVPPPLNNLFYYLKGDWKIIYGPLYLILISLWFFSTTHSVLPPSVALGLVRKGLPCPARTVMAQLPPALCEPCLLLRTLPLCLPHPLWTTLYCSCTSPNKQNTRKCNTYIMQINKTESVPVHSQPYQETKGIWREKSSGMYPPPHHPMGQFLILSIPFTSTNSYKIHSQFLIQIQNYS